MFSLTKENKTLKTVLYAICLMTLALSVLIVLIYGNKFLLGSLEKMNNDDVKYLRSGQILLEYGRLSYNNPNSPTVFIMPGISFVIAALMKLFGFNGAIVAFRLLQCLLNALDILLVFFLGREVFGSKKALVACALCFIYLPFYFSNGVILTEGIFTFLLLLLSYISLHAIRSKSLLLYAAGGAIWAVACLFRPTIALFPAVIFIMWLVYRYSIKDIIRYTLLVSAIFSVIMAPWWIRNYQVFHKVILLTESSGNPMLQGTYIGYKSRLKDPAYLEAQAHGDKPQVELAKKRITENFRKEPFKYIYWYTLGKTIYYWGDVYYWRALFGITKLYMQVFHILLVLVGLAGIIAFTRRNRAALLVLSVILYMNIVHLPYLTASRYAFPVMPLVIIFAAGFAGKFLVKEGKTSTVI